MIKKIIRKFLNIHPDAMSFQNSMDLAELPVVTFHQGDKKINFLLDTGSNNCIIDSTSLKSLKHQTLDITNKVSGIEGIESEEKVCILKLNYKDKEYNFPYIVKDMKPIFDSIKKETGVTVNGMLGSKFFNEFKYVLDFDELIAYSKE